MNVSGWFPCFMTHLYARYLCSRAHSALRLNNAAARPSTRDDMVYCIQMTHQKFRNRFLFAEKLLSRKQVSQKIRVNPLLVYRFLTFLGSNTINIQITFKCCKQNNLSTSQSNSNDKVMNHKTD